MKKAISLILLAAAPLAAAGEYDDIVNRAFDALDQDFQRDWAFTESTEEEGVTYVGRFDPSRPRRERWTLLSVDGRDPTDEEAEDYRDDKGWDFDWNDDNSGNEIVDFDTLTLVEETNDHWIFSFVPVPDDEDDDVGAELMRGVDGTLKVNRDPHYLEYLDLRLQQPMSPAFSVRIDNFLTRLMFGPATDTGPIVPHAVDVRVSGRALFLVTFDETETIRYSDYEYVGD